MNFWLFSFNAKLIGTMYIIFVLIASLNATVISELYDSVIHLLNIDHQLYLLQILHMHLYLSSIIPIKINKKSQGFSSISYDLNAKFFENKIFEEILKSFFKTLKSNKKYFLLLRFKFSSGNIASLHKGLVIDKKSLNRYLEYINNILSYQSNDYADQLITEVIFDFFSIPEKRLNYYTSKWPEIISKHNDVVLGNFTNSAIRHKIPLDQDYLNWGTVMLNYENTLVILSTDCIYNIYKENENFKIEVFKGRDLLLTFSDINIQNKFIDDIQSFNFDFNFDYLYNLPFEQQLIIFNLFSSIILLGLLFSTIINLYSQYLIDKYNLSVKFPKLAKMLFYRSKLQKFNLYYNTVLAFIVILFTITINIILLVL
jgi:hypothetical protein